MKILLAMTLIMLPLTATATGHMDVISFKLQEHCSLSEYLAIKNDFNEQWAKDYSYKAEVAVPLQSDDLTTYYWVGRSANAETFGKAWDAWRDQLEDPDSLAAQLEARFTACSEQLEVREGYDVYCSSFPPTGRSLTTALGCLPVLYFA